jgi:hypothetical protein
MVTLLEADGSPMCLCDAGFTGKMCDQDGNNCQDFVRDCVSEADGGDLLAQKNPTCNSATYAGGAWWWCASS